MDARELLDEGRLDEAIQAVETDIRKAPDKPGPRVFLFQLLCAAQNWDRALTQLGVVEELDGDTRIMAAMYRSAIAGERAREEVFSGRRRPTILGEPPEWVGWLAEALRLCAAGARQAGRALREQAHAAAPETAGVMDGQPFRWIKDADPRLGPVLEVIINGGYYWGPFCRFRSIVVEPPRNLRDLVWAKARLGLPNGGEAAGFIPARYTGAAGSPSPEALLCRRTDWVETDGALEGGAGQRMLLTDLGETALLEAGRIELSGVEGEDGGHARVTT